MHSVYQKYDITKNKITSHVEIDRTFNTNLVAWNLVFKKISFFKPFKGWLYLTISLYQDIDDGD